MSIASRSPRIVPSLRLAALALLLLALGACASPWGWETRVEEGPDGVPHVINRAPPLWTGRGSWSIDERRDGPEWPFVRRFDVSEDGRIYQLTSQGDGPQLRVGDSVVTALEPSYAGSTVGPGLLFDPEGTLWVPDLRHRGYAQYATDLWRIGTRPAFRAPDLLAIDTLGRGYELVDRVEGKRIQRFSIHDTLPGDSFPLPGGPGSTVPRAVDRGGNIWYYQGPGYRLVKASLEDGVLRTVDVVGWDGQGVPKARQYEADPFGRVLKMFVDDRDRLWVLVATEDRSASRLDVFDDAGRYLGTAHAPFGIAGRGIALVVRDHRMYGMRLKGRFRRWSEGYGGYATEERRGFIADIWY